MFSLQQIDLGVLDKRLFTLQQVGPFIEHWTVQVKFFSLPCAKLLDLLFQAANLLFKAVVWLFQAGIITQRTASFT